MKPKLVIFDVDGTLLDTEARWQEAWEVVGSKYGIHDLGTTLFLKCVGKSGQEEINFIKNFLKEAGAPDTILQEANEYGLKLLGERIDVKPGAFELLNKLKEMGTQIGVATATRREWTMERLTRCGLIHYFDYILCGDEVTKRKPDPETYLKVLQHFSVDAKDALVLEDSIVGVEAAYRANIPCIMIPDLVPASSKQQGQTIAIVETLHDVVSMIDN